ncbi:MAG: response regulator [Alphaproteobacteria bacterium]
MKLLIADDHTLFRDALVQYIERSDPNADVTLAKDFHEALSKLEQNPHQDLVILDLRMPGMMGLNGFKTMRDKFPDISVALMSGVAEQEDVHDALEYGAVGYFPKTLSGKALLSAIKQVVDGHIFVPESPNDKTKFMPSYYSDTPQKPIRESLESLNLTPREKEVLSFLVDGAANKEIARELNLQIVTVKLHVRGICRKLNAKNRTQAALKAKEMGVKPFSSAHA